MDFDHIVGRLAVLEYTLTQSFALVLTHCSDPKAALDDCAEHFAKSMEKTSLNDSQRAVARESAERIFTSLRASIPGNEGQSH
jgi:hypothetical protein